MGPEISGFIVFKEMRENQQFKIEEAIELGYKYYLQHNPDLVLKQIEKEN